MSSTYSTFLTILETSSTGNIAQTLNVAPGTVKRWLKLKNVPPAYQFALMRMAKIDIDYTKFTFKEKDQFYTPIKTAKYCFDVFMSILHKYEDHTNNYTFIEPSAGSGNFLEVLPTEQIIAIDIEPKGNKNIKTANFLTWYPESTNDSKYVVVGNPPFGLRGQLALKFINHASTFADYVCFILPQLFSSDGKGVPRKRVEGLNLVHSEPLNTTFLDPAGNILKVNCILQVWSKFHKNSEYDLRKECNTAMRVFSLSDGGTPSSTRNKKMFHSCDIYIPSTCFGRDNMRWYTSFDELPGKRGYGIVFHEEKEANIRKCKSIDWSSVAFLSTNSAFNIRKSQIEQQFY